MDPRGGKGDRTEAARFGGASRGYDEVAARAARGDPRALARGGRASVSRCCGRHAAAVTTASAQGGRDASSSKAAIRLQSEDHDGRAAAQRNRAAAVPARYRDVLAALALVGDDASGNGPSRIEAVERLSVSRIEREK